MMKSKSILLMLIATCSVPLVSIGGTLQCIDSSKLSSMFETLDWSCASSVGNLCSYYESKNLYPVTMGDFSVGGYLSSIKMPANKNPMLTFENIIYWASAEHSVPSIACQYKVGNNQMASFIPYLRMGTALP